MTTFLLIRHAHTHIVGRGLAGRLPGHVLSDEGRLQVEQLVRRLASINIDAVYSSPLERARETAQVIATSRQMPVNIVDGFNEIDFGEWAGRTFEAFDGDAAWQRWNRLRSLSCPPHGEMMLLAQARAVREAFSLYEEYPDSTLAIVSHADILKALVAHFIGVPLDLFGRIEIDLASVSVVRLYDDDVRVLCLNHTGDLRI